MGRLAASETVGLIDRNVNAHVTSDRDVAVQRLERFLEISRNEAEYALDGMLVRMREAPLTINFLARNFFQSVVKEGHYQSTFQTQRAHQMGMPIQVRNTAENKMFGYDIRGRVGPAAGSPGLQAAGDRIAAFGDFGSADFQASIRPKYVTLNVLKTIDGGGAQWGKSHFILKNHLKPNATFIATDSFNFGAGTTMMAPGGQGIIRANHSTVGAAVTSYHNLTRIIIYAADPLLAMAFDAYTGFLGPGRRTEEINRIYALGASQYIEGHIHSDIQFSRDIEKVRIFYSETTPEARENIAMFGKRFGLSVEYFS
jgi:hypothetical protein